jgi:hypothetical protein
LTPVAKPTIHLAVVRAMRPIIGGDSVPWSIARDDPDLRTLALPDAQSVEDLTALLTSAGER